MHSPSASPMTAEAPAAAALDVSDALIQRLRWQGTHLRETSRGGMEAQARTMHDAADALTSLQQQLATSEREREALRADAERYRWIKARSRMKPVADGAVFGPFVAIGSVHKGFSTPNDIDAAIDAASAQVREVDTPEEAAMFELGRKAWAGVPDAAEWQREIRGTAPEPAPVAQGIERFDEMTDCGIQPNTNGRFVRHADHARIVAELEAQLQSLDDSNVAIILDYDHELKRADRAEASLAACRALVPKWRRAADLLEAGLRSIANMARAEQYRSCADQLEAVLPLAGEAQ